MLIFATVLVWLVFSLLLLLHSAVVLEVIVDVVRELLLESALNVSDAREVVKEVPLAVLVFDESMCR